MSDQNYAEWFEGLSEADREYVEELLPVLRHTCADPEALVLADFHSEYALIARHLLYLDDDAEFSYDSARSSVVALKEDHQHTDRFLKAQKAVRRMRAAGITENEIYEFADHVHASATKGVTERIDEVCHGGQFEDPGWALMELRNEKMTGRLIAGGKRFHPGTYELDPWPDDVPRPASPASIL